MRNLFHRLWADEQGQDIAEYAVMLAVILLLVVGTIKLIGTNASSFLECSQQYSVILLSSARDQVSVLAVGISAFIIRNLGSRSAAPINSRIRWSSISAPFSICTGKRTVASMPEDV